MATSGSTNFAVTRDEIIQGALRSLGVLASGETPTANETADAADALNIMCKAWQAEDIGIWLIDTGDITLVASQASYTIGSGGDLAVAKPMDIVEARFYDATSTQDIPMIRMSRQEYYNLPNKASEGIPTQYYPDRQLDLLYLYIWPVWNNTTSDKIKVSIKTEVEDFDATADNPDFPKEWYRALKFNLAVEIAPEYGVEPSQNLMRLAVESKFHASAWDREHTSVYFGVA